jgi:hypothetical protein
LSQSLKKPVRKYPLVYVEWLDSIGVSLPWGYIEDHDTKAMLCSSVGWLTRKDKESIVVMPHLSDENSSVKQQGCGAMTIPAAAVLRIVTLDLKKLASS